MLRKMILIRAFEEDEAPVHTGFMAGFSHLYDGQGGRCRGRVFCRFTPEDYITSTPTGATGTT